MTNQPFKKTGYRDLPSMTRVRAVFLYAVVFLITGFLVLPLTLPPGAASATEQSNVVSVTDLSDIVPAADKAETAEIVEAVRPAAAEQTQRRLDPQKTAAPTPESMLILYPEAEPLENETAPVLETVEFGPGDEDEFIKELQARLMELEYMDPDVPTSRYGPMTENAVMLFQAVHGLTGTGVADKATQKRLFDETAVSYRMKKGSEGKDVLNLQQRLYDLGFYEGFLNGYFGTATERALRAFQAMNGLIPDGIADPDTRELLFSPGAVPKTGPTPSPEPTPKPTASVKPSSPPKPTASPKPTEKPTPLPSAAPAPTPEVSVTPLPSPQNTPEPSAEPAPTQTPIPFPIPNPSAMPAPSPTKSPGIVIIGSGSESMISVALDQLGKPYRWSEEGPDGFDCSGLVYYSLRSVGVAISRYSANGFSQVESWEYVGSLNELRRGDLMFFRSDSSDRISHTGIYLGDGTFVHASSSAGKVILSSVTSYYERNFMLGRRVF